MLFFLALTLFCVAVLLEKNGKAWFSDEGTFLAIRIGLYFTLVSYGVVLLLRLSMISTFTLILTVPWVFLALWQLVRLAYRVWPNRLAPWFLLIFLLVASWGFRSITPSRVHPVMLVEYILDETQPVPRTNSINPEVHRLVRI